MDTTAFDYLLSHRLSDPNGTKFSAELRSAAMVAAAAAYGEYFPMVRRYGAGELAAQAAVAATSATVSGGPFEVGDSVVFEPHTALEETLAITAITPELTPGSSLANANLKLTLGSALAHTHAQCAPVQNSVLGLRLRAGQDTYRLPKDFVRIEQESFDLTVTGQRTEIRRTESFYDAVYALSNRISQSGYGTNQNYGQSGRSFYGAYGNAANQTILAGGSGQAIYRFIKGANPELVMIPAPTADRTLDPLFYFATVSPEMAPQAAAEDLLIYALWACMVGEVAMWSSKPNYSQADISKSPDKQVKSVMEAAASLIERWDLKTRFKPYAVGG